MAPFIAQSVFLWVIGLASGTIGAIVGWFIMTRSIRKHIEAEFGRHIPYAEIQRLDKVVPAWVRGGLVTFAIAVAVAAAGLVFVIFGCIELATQ